AATGKRLLTGLGIVAIGFVLTYVAIRSGLNTSARTQLSPEFCNVLWQVFRGTLALISIAGAYGVFFWHNRMRGVEWSILLGADLLLAALTVWLLAHPENRLDDSGIRILWQLMKGGGAALVQLVGLILVFRKRAGIVLLHEGVALMML